MSESDALFSPQPEYQVDRAFYDKVRAAERQPVDKFVIAPFNGRGFIVKKGQSFRVIQEEGPQVGDVAFWNADDAKETLSCLRTWEVDGWFLEVYSRLWSDVPWLRPMVTCIEDTVAATRDGHRAHHHFLASHCAPEQQEMRTGKAGLNACRVNFLQAIEPFGLSEEHLLENIDVFTQFIIDPVTGKFSGARTDTKPGDYIEFYAEIDLLVAVSVCPAGDYSQAASKAVLPLGVEIHETGIEPKTFPAWASRE